ncbi:WAT1-related protein At3g30340-like [Camellia sinensis]|uniref:WAT1-related protein At3g30340-like n=1 Tax=Camellia sinensis TaxID=4442 RepID=UPI00103664D5|nr:WAT1-related protein At3g30340-like [Camellia sinensis]
MKSCEEWNPVFAMIGVDFGFAIANILLKKVVDGGMNHLVFITYRQSISTIFLAPIGYFSERNSRPKLTFGILCHLFLSAIVGASLTQYFFLLGIQYTSATFSCAFINMVPVVTFLMALPFGLEKVQLKGSDSGSSGGRAKVVGALVCLGGAMILTLYKGMPLFNHSHESLWQGGAGNIDQVHDHVMVLSSGRRKERWTIGSMALMAGTLLWSSWFLIQSNIVKRYPCQYSSTAIMSFFAAIQSTVLAFSINRRNLSIWALNGKMEFLTVFYAGMVGSGLCYVGMSWCVKKRGPLFTAAFSPLVQIMAAMVDIPILHEQLHLGSLVGSVTVIAGLYILLWGKNKEMQNCATKVASKDGEPPLALQVIVNSIDCDSRHP